MKLLDINDKQRDILRTALETREPARGHHATLRVLRELGLITDENNPTILGRYQVCWYSDDAAGAWGIESGTWLQYVKRGTAPEPTARGTFGSSTDRPWWDPRTVLTFKRPGQARKGEHRKPLSEVDMQTIVREYRGGISIRKLAARYNLAVSTLASRLEELGEKPMTTATREEKDRRMAAYHATKPESWKRS